MSSRIIPKELLGTDLRKAKLDDFSSAGRGLRPAKSNTAAVSPVDDAARIRDEAYRQGLAAGRQEAAAQMEAQHAALKGVSDGLRELVQDFEQSLANDVLSMSLELTKLIVRQTVRVKPEVVLSVIHEAIASLAGLDQHTTIHLNPADAVLLRELGRDDNVLATLPWKIAEDAQIERGGCRLETDSTEVDATLETRWRRVIAALGREDPWIEITL